MKKICRVYDYSTAEESREPGYLKAKFDKLRRKLEAEKKAAEAQAARSGSVVRRISK